MTMQQNKKVAAAGKYTVIRYYRGHGTAEIVIRALIRIHNT